MSETLLKKRLQHRRFPVDIAKFLRSPILKISVNYCFCICAQTQMEILQTRTIATILVLLALLQIKCTSTASVKVFKILQKTFVIGFTVFYF